MLFNVLSVLYVLVCAFLIFVVLLQPGRGGGMGGAFGGAASQQVFGGAGATNILQKMTAVSAAVFMILSLTLAYLSTSDNTALDDALQQVQSRRGSASSMGGASSMDGASSMGAASSMGGASSMD